VQIPSRKCEQKRLSRTCGRGSMLMTTLPLLRWSGDMKKWQIRLSGGTYDTLDIFSWGKSNKIKEGLQTVNVFKQGE